MVSRNFSQDQIVPYDLTWISALSSFCCPLWLNSDIWLLIFALKSRAVRLGDFYNQLQVNSHVRKAGYADTCRSTVITANSLCVFFSKLKSPDICLKMLTQVNKIIWYINSYQSAINWVSYFMFTIVFQWYSLGRQVAESPKPRPFKPDRPRTFANSLCRMKKKTFILRASGSQFTCAPHMIPLSAAAEICGPSFYWNSNTTMIQVKTKTILNPSFSLIPFSSE